MSIDISCGGCGKSYVVPDSFANQRARCLICGAVTLVPDPAEFASDFDLLAAMGATAPAGNRAAAADAADAEMEAVIELPSDYEPIPMPEPVDAVDGVDGVDAVDGVGELDGISSPPLPVDRIAPEARTPPPAGPPAEAEPSRRFGLHLHWAVLLAWAAGGALLYFGLQRRATLLLSASGPHAMTCLQLEQRGPGMNPYVRLSGFTGLPRGFVCEYEKKEAGNEEIWQTVWVPVVSVDGDFARASKLSLSIGQFKSPADIPPPGKISVILKSRFVKSARQEDILIHRPFIDGLIVNSTEPLTREQALHLNGPFPATDFTGAWIVEADLKPPGSGSYLALLGGGGALIALGLALMLRPRGARLI